jgi:uncharacterized Tic20 family protein
MSLIGVSLVYGFMLYGLVLLVVSFSGPFNIMDRFRDLMHWLHPQLGKLVECPYCSSFWCGVILSAINYLFIPIAFTPFNIIFAGSGLWWLIIPFDTFFGCAAVWLLHVLDEYLESNTKNEYEDE